jgi:hypothetical protein
MDAPTDHSDEAVEQAGVRKLSTDSQGRICPRCSSPTLVRYRRPFYLRWLRLARIELRTYQCAMCGMKCILRNRS